MGSSKKSVRSKKARSKCKGPRILPDPIDGSLDVTHLVDEHFNSYNAGRLREGCDLFAKKMLRSGNVTIGLSLSGALTPAGLGISVIVPMMKAGFVDWICSTGANLYHDTHFALDCHLYRGGLYHDDLELRKDKVVRIYDVLFDYDVLLDTDAFYRQIFALPEFRCEMSSSELHHKIGKYVAKQEEALGLSDASILAAAYRLDIPIYTPSPGDSSIGMNIAEAGLDCPTVRFDIAKDVNETAGIVLNAKRSGGKSAVVIIGGGSPKNFMLQTEPQIQEVLGIKENGHDYFLQITDARPDTGGLSGATPSEAVTWGKVDGEMLPDTVVVYTDATIALPILASYLMGNCKPRKQKRLFSKRDEAIELLKKEYEKARRGRLRRLEMKPSEARGKRKPKSLRKK